MTNKWNRVLLCVVFAGLTTAWAVAQDDSTTGGKSKGEVRNITGCLTKSGGGDEYLLTGTDGSTWEIHENSAVDLASHVNQTVEVRGAVSNKMAHNMKEDTKEMAKDSGMKKSNNEHGHLKVTDVKKLSDTCQQ